VPSHLTSTAPPQALEALAGLPDGSPVVVDFDHTLLLANSTRLFIEHARPRWLAWLLVKLAHRLFRMGPAAWQPAWPAVAAWVVALALPWSVWTWRRAAPLLARQWVNAPLRAALAPHRQRSVVCTYGLSWIVGPLLAALWPGVPLVASRLRTAVADRQQGKVAMLARAGWQVPSPGGAVQWAAVTDSLDDAALLAQSPLPLWVNWPDQAPGQWFEGLYLPLRYAHRLRYPEDTFVLRVLLWEEWVGLMLIFWPVVWAFPGFALVLFGFMLSFWVVYEQGYAENDRVAILREGKQPQPHEAARFEGAFHSGEGWAWVWAAALAVPAAWAWVAWQVPAADWPLLVGPWSGLMPAAAVLAVWSVWMLVLLGCRLLFRAYNHSPVSKRVWLYGGLQLCKTLPMGLWFTLNAVGMAYVFAYAVSRWMPYWVYRLGGNRRAFPERLLRFILLAVGLGAFGQLAQADPVVWAQAGLMLVYMGMRSRREAWAVLQETGDWTDRSRPWIQQPVHPPIERGGPIAPIAPRTGD
jgi:hypothetical protein